MIEINELEMKFNEKRLFAASALQINSHGLLQICGVNGCGKTTLLRILASLTRPSGGDILINGLSVCHQDSEVRKLLGYAAAQGSRFFPRLTGRENLVLFARLRGLKARQIEDRLQWLTDTLDLSSALETPYALASSGMQQKLNLSRALLHEPPIVIFDEPFRSLDAEGVSRLKNLMLLQSSQNLVIFVDHTDSFSAQNITAWEIKEQRLALAGRPARFLLRSL